MKPTDEITKAKKLAMTEVLGKQALDLGKSLGLSPFDMLDTMARSLVAMTCSNAKDGEYLGALEGVQELTNHHFDKTIAAIKSGELDEMVAAVKAAS